MEKEPVEIDMEDWELLLPDGNTNTNSYLDLGLAKELRFNPRDMIHMDYFTCPPPDSCQCESDDGLITPTTHNPIAEENSDDGVMQGFKDIGVVPPPVINKLEEEEEVKVKGEKEEVYKEENLPENNKPKAWRRRVNGIGALCSIAVAAATVCIFILGGRQQRLKMQQHQNQRIQFQIYAGDQRMKQVVQQATRLNQALWVVRGVPMTRAHISFGGYYDGI